MNFYTAKELRTSPKALWDDLKNDGSVAILRNGKPAALMVEVDGRTLDDAQSMYRQFRFNDALKRMRARAESMGFMTEEEIEAEIAAARKEKRDAA